MQLALKWIAPECNRNQSDTIINRYISMHWAPETRVQGYICTEITNDHSMMYYTIMNTNKCVYLFS